MVMSRRRYIIIHRACLVAIFSMFLFSIVSLSMAETNANRAKTALTSKEILDRMLETYTRCKTYQDSGLVKITFFQTDDEMISERPFTTVFVRPDIFRYEYKEKKCYSNKEQRYIIWRKGDEISTWWDVKPGIEKRGSLGLAIAGATGVSGGSAHQIPALLMPDQVGGRKLADITEAKRIADALFNGNNCFRIEGKFVGSPMVLWIDSRTFLVRRIDEQNSFPDFRTETTTIYYPVTDGDIAAKLLDFDPPKSK